MGQGGSTSYLCTSPTRDLDFETIYQSAPMSIRDPLGLGIKKPGSAGGVLSLYFCFLGIFFFLFGIICCFLYHSAFTMGFIGFIFLIFFHPFTSPVDYRRFILFLSSFSYILYTFVYLGHKLSVFLKKKKREKRKTRIYTTFLTPLSRPKMHHNTFFCN